jgi:broad specificity phosphatase PhoE
MKLQWGQQIIDKLQKVPARGRHILIIRHSERPDFRDIPVDRWNSVLLTEKGIQAAVNFGESLVGETGLETITTEGWGLERCVITARKIAEGASNAGSRNCKFSIASDLQSPIENHEKYEEYLKSGRWNDMLALWLSSPSENGVMRPFKSYSRGILKEVLENHLPESNCANVIVTHDLHIFPIITAIFNRIELSVDFMDGIMISKYDDGVKIFHNDLSSDAPI